MCKPPGGWATQRLWRAGSDGGCPGACAALSARACSVAVILVDRCSHDDIQNDHDTRVVAERDTRLKLWIQRVRRHILWWNVSGIW